MSVEEMVEHLERLGIAPPRLSWCRSYEHWANMVIDAYEDSLIIG